MDSSARADAHTVGLVTLTAGSVMRGLVVPPDVPAGIAAAIINYLPEGVVPRYVQ